MSGHPPRRRRLIHRTSRARPGPESDRPVPPPTPPPAPPAMSGVWRILLLVAGLVLAGWLIFGTSQATTASPEINYTELLHQTDNNNVTAVTVDSNGAVQGTFKDGKQFTSQLPTAMGDNDLYQQFAEHGVAVTAKPPSSSSWASVLGLLLPLLLIVGMFVWMGRRTAGQIGAMGSVGRSRVKVIESERPTVRFEDVAGYESVKREVGEIIEFLRRPDRYTRAGATGPRGVLMVGPPGTGKTLLARAIAGEASVPFLSVTGSAFVEMFVGVGAARVRDLFSEARKRAPAIIFIDEIDAIGQRRGGGFVSNDEREQTLNQLLAEMDGFDAAEGVVVLAATNRPDVLDPALLRPGRFDRQVVVPLPNQVERRAILAVHCGDKALGPDVSLDAVARATPGFSGADLANLANEAAINAVRDGRDTLQHVDFQEARDRILLGLREGSNVLLPEEKLAVAVHEAGHALIAALSDHADPVEKVTILPAGQALGATEQLPLVERHLLSETWMHTALAVRLGGRAAELVRFGEGSTGASNDLSEATDLATRMVREFGLSDALGPVGYAATGPMYLGRDQVSMRQYSEATQRLIDQEVARLVREAERVAVDLLSAHRGDLDRLTALLMARETIDGSEVYTLVGRSRPERRFEANGGPAAEPGPVAGPASPAGPAAPAVDDLAEEERPADSAA